MLLAESLISCLTKLTANVLRVGCGTGREKGEIEMQAPLVRSKRRLVEMQVAVSAGLHCRRCRRDLVCVRLQFDPARMWQDQDGEGAAREVLLMSQLLIRG